MTEILWENLILQKKNKELKFKEQRICFETEEETVKFVEMLDEDDFDKIFHRLMIVKVFTV
jgi:hypothetical protein